MYNLPNTFQYPYYVNEQIYNNDNIYNYYRMPQYRMPQCPYCGNMSLTSPNLFPYISRQYVRYSGPSTNPVPLKDYGPNPFSVDIEEATNQNSNFRTALWTGDHLQLTLMSINVGDDIGLEVHEELDQFIRIEQGQGIVRMGDRKDRLDYQAEVRDDYIIIIPAGKWHNLINTGNIPLKLYSIYAPPQHPRGTVHRTRADAIAAEEDHTR